MTDEGYVSTLYTGLLDRAPDMPGLEYWSDVPTGDTLTVTNAFLDAGDWGGDSDAAFLDNLYWSLFDREADSGGMDYWSGRMADGASRAEVTHAIINGADGLDEIIMDQRAHVGQTYAEEVAQSPHEYDLAEAEHAIDLFTRADVFGSDAYAYVWDTVRGDAHTGEMSVMGTSDDGAMM